jgi:cytochrome P450
MIEKFPPGPKASLFQALVYRPGRNPLEFFESVARTYGDLAYVRLGGEHVFVVSDPRVIKDVLMTHNQNFTKSRGLERTKRLLGEGLLTSEGAVHLRQRRLMQPAFHRDRVANYAATMIEYAERARGRWTDGETLDVAQEMSRLTLSVVGKTLFDTDVESQARDVGDALTGVMESFWTLMLPFSKTIERLPLPHMRRTRQARARLDAIIYGLIRDRRAAGGDRGDLLSMLLLAQDEEEAGRRMTDLQVRDEAMTIFLAGHETTANALMWTWYLLSQAPEAERMLHLEIDRVLRGRLPAMADITALPYLERVVTESMRLYPPAWIVGRRAIGPYHIDGYTMPARSIVIMSQWIVHRDARHYADPSRFNPDRWMPELRASLPQFAYFPFGGGPRRCIGESFAWMELMLMVATLAQRWRFELVPGHPVVTQPLVTLRAKHGMKMVAHRRQVE